MFNANFSSISSISWRVGIRVIVFNVTFNKISVISWWSISLVEETGVHRENNWPARKSLSSVQSHLLLFTQIKYVQTIKTEILKNMRKINIRYA
jgi:hypothetical protein